MCLWLRANRRRFTALASLAAAVVVLALSQAAPLTFAQATPTVEPPQQPPSARNGHAIYQENCAACHGVRGAGDGPTAAQLPGPATAFADPEVGRQAIPAEWFQVTKEGRMSLFMPPWQNRLSDEQIWDAVAFALTLHTSQAELARGQTVWQETCATCHGAQGAGDGPQAAANGWQMASLADLAYSSQHSLSDWFQVTSEGRGAMPALGDQLAAEDIWAAVAYARTFTFQPAFALQLPPGEGRIAGVLSNGTPGGDAVGGLTVTLQPFQDFEALPAQQTTAAADGSFAFTGLPTDEAYAYLLTTTYKGVDFRAGPINFAGGPEQTAPLTVYEASTTPGAIRADLAQWFVDYQEGALLVGELYRLTHDSDRAYLGGDEVAPGKRSVLQFDLPPGYTRLAADGGEIGERFIVTEQGVVDTQPLPPGQSQVLLRYFLPYTGTRADLTHAVRYPVGRFSLLASQDLDVKVDGLQPAGTQSVGDRVFVNYEAQNVPASQPVSIQLRNLARSVASAADQAPAVLAHSPALLFGLVAAIAATVLALLALALIGSRPAAKPAAATRGAAAAERNRLLQAIADLDDRYEAGAVSAADYTAQRASLKRALLAMSGQAHAASSPAVGEPRPRQTSSS